ncbi:hypothetical protein KC799_08815 [candidate division KSB1 bacterium]|nr:hypothetical protein [candidate division KSB1 bacterium]
MSDIHRRGQALVEYSLILSLVAIVLIAVFMALSSRISSMVDALIGVLAENGVHATWIPETPSNPYQTNFEDFQSRIMDYYDNHGSWPSKKSPKNFTSIGLDPADWSDPIDGIIWTPKGNKVNLQNANGDDIQIYVNDLNGNTLHLYDGWKIICPMTDTTCYYKKVEPGNEVDITTIQAVQE